MVPNATRPNSQISPTTPSSVFVSITRVAANTFIVWCGITFSRKISSCRWWLYIPSMGFYFNYHLSRGYVGDANSRWEHWAFVSFHGEFAVIQLITGWYIGFLEDEKERDANPIVWQVFCNKFTVPTALRWLCAIVMQTFWLGEFITDMHISL
jgi:hypothetical protein